MLSSLVLAALAGVGQAPAAPPAAAPVAPALTTVAATAPVYYSPPSHRWSGGLFSRWSSHGSGCHGGTPVVVQTPAVTTSSHSHASHFSSRQTGHLAGWWQNWQTNFRSHFHHGNGCTGGTVVYSTPATGGAVTPATPALTPDAAKPLPSGVPTAPAPDPASKKTSAATVESDRAAAPSPGRSEVEITPTILPINFIDPQKQGGPDRDR